jgi:hypothetical protein
VKHTFLIACGATKERRRSSKTCRVFENQRAVSGGEGEGGWEVARFHADSDDTAGGMSLIFVLPFSVVKT